MNASVPSSCLKEVTVPLWAPVSSYLPGELDSTIADVDSSISEVLGLEQRVAGKASRSALSRRNVMQITCVILNSLVPTLKKVKRNR